VKPDKASTRPSSDPSPVRHLLPGPAKASVQQTSLLASTAHESSTTGETGLFVQLPPGRLRLTPGSRPTGKAPTDLAGFRVPPPKQEDPPPPIEADDASGAPVGRLIMPVKVEERRGGRAPA